MTREPFGCALLRSRRVDCRVASRRPRSAAARDDEWLSGVGVRRVTLILLLSSCSFIRDDHHIASLFGAGRFVHFVCKFTGRWWCDGMIRGIGGPT